MTREEAIALHDSKFYETMSYKERAMFQAFEPRLCMPFSVFHEAVEKTLGRSVWTHEFAGDEIKKELLGDSPAPSMEDIITMIPEHKRVILNWTHKKGE
jgi:hypothetical protein